jgi:hypothetical protein
MNLSTFRSQTGRQPKYIVSDDLRFVYFVIPKVACTSIKSALLPLFNVNTPEGASIREDIALGLEVHRIFGNSKFQVNRTQFERKLSRGEYREYFKFAFVRNPWDRLVSCYSHKIIDVDDTQLEEPPFRERRGGTGAELYKGMSFAEFVETVCDIPDEEANMHFRSQHEVVCGSGKDKPIMADFVGRFENLAADFSVVAERIGRAQELCLPHRFRSVSRGSRPYTEFYDDRLRNLVYERYREDIEIFSYSFGELHSLSPH